MNSLTLIDSVLTRSFSTSAVPQQRRRRRAANSSSPSPTTTSRRPHTDNDQLDESDTTFTHEDDSSDHHHHLKQHSEPNRSSHQLPSRPSTADNLTTTKQQQQQQQQQRRTRPSISPITPLPLSQPSTADVSSSDEEPDPLSHREAQVDPTPITSAAGPPLAELKEPQQPAPTTAEKAEPAPAAVAAAAAAVAAAPKPIPRGPSSVIRHTPKILVLDLDETLIHSTSRPRPGYDMAGRYVGVGGAGRGVSALFGGGGGRGTATGTGAGANRLSSFRGLGLGLGLGWLLGLDGLGALLGLRGRAHSGRLRTHMVEVVLDGRSLIYHVYKRPWVDYFLRKVATWYHVVVYTASVQEYADPVIDWLDQGRGLISGRLFRDACIFSNGTYLKNLSIVDSDLARVCLVDNSPASYLINPANGIPIEGWTHDPNDEALLDLLPVLDSLRFASDVRHILGLRGF
ncbi:Nuclear envelope morphology protein 1 [Tilletia horrida]|uniref:Nuclear envelope morphology protein 1 n=1 Tax=Tilletia horrida TaxID=155126 RepID=A0AAN6GRY6_9BASI|nr:Nuclear envelope morphology protein 1 [Tilletia horrida]KAK0553714.1 Nuclear envelope morphology protein 1 [Tilletia horrida]KAK0567660.1 Nuclear envelope morphology protein 1 [Tilletia horrida]